MWLPRDSWIIWDKFFSCVKRKKENMKSLICQYGISYVKEPVLILESKMIGHELILCKLHCFNIGTKLNSKLNVRFQSKFHFVFPFNFQFTIVVFSVSSLLCLSFLLDFHNIYRLIIKKPLQITARNTVPLSTYPVYVVLCI